MDCGISHPISRGDLSGVWSIIAVTGHNIFDPLDIEYKTFNKVSSSSGEYGHDRPKYVSHESDWLAS